MKLYLCDSFVCLFMNYIFVEKLHGVWVPCPPPSFQFHFWECFWRGIEFAVKNDRTTLTGFSGGFVEFYENGFIINGIWINLNWSEYPEKRTLLKLNDFQPRSQVASFYKIIAKLLSMGLNYDQWETQMKFSGWGGGHWGKTVLSIPFLSILHLTFE